MVFLFNWGLQIPNLGIIIPKMGRKNQPSGGLASALFSRVQLRVLALLFGQPSRTFHASELIRLAGSGSGAVQRELLKLAAAGIIAVAVSGNRKFYQANRQSPIFKELVGLINKTAGLIEPLRQGLNPYRDGIEAAFVYGSVAKGGDSSKSDIDVMIIADELSYSDVYAALQKAEKTLMRPVNPTLISGKEWHQKLSQKKSFVSKVFEQPKLYIFGSDSNLEGTR